MSNSKEVQRYKWEDTLTDAQAAGVIPEGAWALAIKLARAINWNPKDGRKPGLYLANVQAAESVGSSRATLYRYEALLIQAGFFTSHDGNLFPTIPEQSQVETITAGADIKREAAKARQASKRAKKSHIETNQSQVETQQSQVEHPLTEDILTEDLLSADSLTEHTPDAEAPGSFTPESPFIVFGRDSEFDDIVADFGTIDSGEVPQSQSETDSAQYQSEIEERARKVRQVAIYNRMNYTGCTYEAAAAYIDAPEEAVF